MHATISRTELPLDNKRVPEISDVPLAVKPKRACKMLDCGTTRLYELINAGRSKNFATVGRERSPQTRSGRISRSGSPPSGATGRSGMFLIAHRARS